VEPPKTPPAPVSSQPTERRAQPPLASLYPYHHTLIGPIQWPRESETVVLQGELGHLLLVTRWLGREPSEVLVRDVKLRGTYAIRKVDGWREPMLFLFREPTEADIVTLCILAMDDGHVGRMRRLELALAGVHDAASLETELTRIHTLRNVEPMRIEQLFARLWFAPGAAQAEILPSDGVQLCRVDYTHQLDCSVLEPRALADKAWRLSRWGAYCDEPRKEFEPLNCPRRAPDPDGARDVCRARCGGVSYEWLIERRGGEVKVLQIIVTGD
jgi:hypothetical protein